jgi:hypothetical protein
MNVQHVQAIETATMISRASAETLVDQTDARKTAPRPSLMKLFKLPSQD